MKRKLPFIFYVVIGISFISYNTALAQAGILTVLTKETPDNGSTWTVFSKEYSEFDAQSLEITKLVEIYQGSPNILNQTRNKFSYNAQGLVEYDSIEHWFNTYWFATNRNVHSYTATNKVSVSKYQNFGPQNNWIDVHKQEFTYDVTDNLISVYVSPYNYDTSAWMAHSSRTLYQYGSNGLISFVSDEEWSPSLQQFTVTFTTEYSYDNLLRITLRHHKSYNGAALIGESKVHYSYNGNSTLVSNLISELRASNEIVWSNSLKRDFLYDTNNKLYRITNSNWDTTVSGNWKQVMRYTYFYPTLGTEDFTLDEKFSAYPNPFNDVLTLKTPKAILGTPYIIHDISGKTITAGQLTGEETIIDNNIKVPGMYFVKVGNSAEAIKVIKKE